MTPETLSSLGESDGDMYACRRRPVGHTEKILQKMQKNFQ